MSVGVLRALPSTSLALHSSLPASPSGRAHPTCCSLKLSEEGAPGCWWNEAGCGSNKNTRVGGLMRGGTSSTHLHATMDDHHLGALLAQLRRRRKLRHPTGESLQPLHVLEGVLVTLV
jgi:hypothetical protein